MKLDIIKNKQNRQQTNSLNEFQAAAATGGKSK